MALSFSVHVGVLLVEWVTLTTHSPTKLHANEPIAAPQILSTRDNLKMVRVDTRSIAAAVV